MKSGRTKGGPDRERAYWEPPKAGIGQIDAHIEEIEPPEPGVTPVPGERGRRRIWGRIQPSRLALVAGMAALVAAAAIANWPADRPQASPSNVAVASPQVEGVATAADTPTLPPSPSSPSPTPYVPPTFPWPTSRPSGWTPQPATPEPTDTPVPGPSYELSTGWPYALDDAGDPTSSVVVGPDGTVYVDGQPPLDASGRSKAGRLQLPDGTYGQPVLFGPDGTIYVEQSVDIPGTDDVPDTSSTNLYAFAKDGKLKAGWPVADVGDEPGFDLGASGSVVVYAVVGDSERVTVLTKNGATQASWVLGASYGVMFGQGVGADGTLFFAYAEDGAPCDIVTYSAQGKRLSKTPSRLWDSLTVSPQGAVVAVGYDTQPYSNSVVARTRVAVIGTDGQPLAGWPVSLEGAVSDPAFGPDGTLYMTELGLGTSPSRVVALTPQGQQVSGWPVDLPSGFGPFSPDGEWPVAPVVSPSGTVYVTAVDGTWMGWVVALDSTGAPLPGWPYRLPEPLADIDGGGYRGEDAYNPGPILPASSTSNIAIYLALDGRLDAVGTDGTEAPGWPHMLAGGDEDGDYWEEVLPAPDGGLVALSVDSETGGYSLIRLTPAGSLAH